jgi:hypothetical protein
MRYADVPNYYGCFDPQCLDSTWDHACPVVPPEKELLFSGGTGLPCQLKGEIHEPHGLCPGIDDSGLYRPTEVRMRWWPAFWRALQGRSAHTVYLPNVETMVEILDRHIPNFDEHSVTRDAESTARAIMSDIRSAHRG